MKAIVAFIALAGVCAVAYAAPSNVAARKLSILQAHSRARVHSGQPLPPVPPSKPAADPYADLRLGVFGGADHSVSLNVFPVEAGSRITQRLGYDSASNIFCESTATIAATPEALVALIQGPWTWWQGGQQTNRVVQPTGTDYILYPAWLGVNVHEHMHPAEPYGNGGYLIRIDFIGDRLSFAEGRGYFLVLPTGTPGHTQLYGRFAAVKSRVLPHTIFAETHLKGERGHLFGGLLKAGWWHLIEIAEGREKLPATYSLFTPPAKVQP